MIAAAVYALVTDLKPWGDNPRDNEAAVDHVVASIKRFGFGAPIVANTNGRIIAGHTRYQAALKLGLKSVPVRYLELDDAEAKALSLADNKLGEIAQWNEAKLSRILVELRSEKIELGGLGWDDAAITRLLSATVSEVSPGFSDPDEVLETPETESLTNLGDLWKLGKHKLLCADSLDLAEIQRLFAGVKPHLVYADPPYGISVVQPKSAWKGRGLIGGGNNGPGGKPYPFGGLKGTIDGSKPFGAKRMSNGDGGIIPANTYAPIIGDESTITAIQSRKICADLKIPVLVYWGANCYASGLPDSRGWLVWDKQTTGDFSDAELAWTNQDRAISRLIHTWNGLQKASERGQRRVHPTQKPVALATWVFDLLAPLGCVVFDPFGGSGSSLIACEQSERICLMMELSPAYCDVVLNRWSRFTGKDPIRTDGVRWSSLVSKASV